MRDVLAVHCEHASAVEVPRRARVRRAFDDEIDTMLAIDSFLAVRASRT
ncbi:MAG: hypothetical protein M5U07_15610 [Xanthobacteraceae bacterium]|nr:hypothetical protein [Xanthobacteraceae bacterium]